MAEVDYATTAELKAYLGISDSARDAVLADALATASRWIEQTTGRRFWIDDAVSLRTIRTYRNTVVAGLEYALLVPDIATSVGLIVTHSPVSTDASNVPITRIYSGVPWPESAVDITAKWGWPYIPDEIKQATLILAARLFKRKDSPEGVAGSASWGAIRVSRRDPDVQALIDPYSLPGIA